MDPNSYNNASKFVDLLTSQQSVFGFPQDSVQLSSSQVPYFGTQAHEASNFAEEGSAERREWKQWTPIDDLVLISAWLNTSKDAVVGNEQRCGTFWKRVEAYVAASPKFIEHREASNCKQRWQKINDIVNKFCGAYEAAKLRNDQKWCELSTSKTQGSSKRRKCDDGAQSSTSHTHETTNGEEDQGASRPPGVKAAKAQRNKKDLAAEKKKDLPDGKVVAAFENMWSIKKEDLALKEKLSKMKMLECLLAKSEPLADYEEALKKKLITDLLSLSPLQKCTAAIRCLAYGTAADTVDKYLRLGLTTTRACLENFVERIINLFGDEYLRIPTPADLQHLLEVGEYRGFPGMIGSIDCTLNNINVLNRSHVFDDIIKGQAPQVTFSVNGREYHLAYYLTDGIYPKWKTFIQSIPMPQGPKAFLFAQQQEAVRKDVERAFGVLQARFAIVKNPSLFWDKIKIGKIMRACIILHNMIVKDERDGYTQYDVSEFQQREDNASFHVDLTYSTDIPTNIANMMGVRTRVRDKTVQQQLKDDLVEHIWRKFGRNEDNN
uniref:Myb-like domain-containing protein n=1 Tax=Brassica oleracea var. oleracea TaxID=109376 RepID=A0A0D3BEE1_BRAOL